MRERELARTDGGHTNGRDAAYFENGCVFIIQYFISYIIFFIISVSFFEKKVKVSQSFIDKFNHLLSMMMS